MIDRYQTIVFDCDGVILNSNKVKTDAFFQAALPYGEELANALVRFHVENGGISRYVKFKHFLDDIVPEGAKGPALKELLISYAQKVRAGLLECDVTPGLDDLRQASGQARWLVASGGDQGELREVFAERGLDTLFDGGIFGSPDAKDDILARELTEREQSPATLFVGDSRYDHVVSQKFGLEFVFVTQWTEFYDWKSYSEENVVFTVTEPYCLLL
ncbi:HAD family hydrolase [Marinimicrobium sp. ABcell2]|uniref:HAD family hydrolase n=1 Tax=Marinimicrobium sp. ABcell2 TaxID=3069751 RepID=UPI0027ADBCA5|nr:HAD family hydrolase [Marinimicrobium sp. ABcell2]MDQ2078329.1 HAD hydrolase-like protein [Marinimicrobium sp. ABcell2]